MGQHSNIKSLNLSQNKLDSVAASALAEFLCEPRCRLEELYLAKAGQCEYIYVCVYVFGWLALSACCVCCGIRYIIFEYVLDALNTSEIR